ncbi:MAG: hypothetical protein RIS85_2402, partial [Pseudomonadota bacterium]
MTVQQDFLTIAVPMHDSTQWQDIGFADIENALECL